MKNILNGKVLGAIAIVIVLGGGGWAIHRSFAGGGGAAAVDASQAVAVVNGENITQGQLHALEAQMVTQEGLSATSSTALAAVQSSALTSLIGQTLLEQAAAKAGIVASSTEVDQQFQATKSHYSSETDFENALKQNGLTEDQLRAQIANDLAIEAYLDQTLNLASTTATQAEIQTAYDQAVAGKTGAPPLSQVEDQVKQMVIQQKQQQDVQAEVQRLQSEGSVQILISAPGAATTNAQ